MNVPQILGIFIIFAGVAFFVKRSLSRPKGLGSVLPGIEAFRTAFMQTRAPGEPEPTYVVAFHYGMASVEQVTVGVTDRRVLVVRGGGPLHNFPYDNEGEHLPSAQKKAQRRGFFDWSHGDFNDGSRGYSPTVKSFPPFAGQTWRMYPTIPEFPEQKANLKEFSRRFYFQWFYD